MTLPSERTRAVVQTEEFLSSLLDPKKTPRVPKAIRQWAGRLLRHYPWPSHLHRSHLKDPATWGKPELDGEE